MARAKNERWDPVSRKARVSAVVFEFLELRRINVAVGTAVVTLDWVAHLETTGNFDLSTSVEELEHACLITVGWVGLGAEASSVWCLEEEF